jgi:hypothetical protein
MTIFIIIYYSDDEAEEDVTLASVDEDVTLASVDEDTGAERKKREMLKDEKKRNSFKIPEHPEESPIKIQS